jgi:transcriptional regulator with XRE-family HTH domain
VDPEQPTAGRELARLETRIAELQAQARLLRDEIAGDATFRELLDQVDPHNDAKERHARHVGRNLRRIREERELSQRQLGMLLGYASGQRISYWELGRKAPVPGASSASRACSRFTGPTSTRVTPATQGRGEPPPAGVRRGRQRRAVETKRGRPRL